MTAILTPALAIRQLCQLSTDVRAAIVLDADGSPLAGDVALAAPARELLERAVQPSVGAGGERLGAIDLAVATAGGFALVASAGSVAIVVAAGPHTLLPLLRHDLRMLLLDLSDEPFDAPPERSDHPRTPVGERVQAAADALSVIAASISVR